MVDLEHVLHRFMQKMVENLFLWAEILQYIQD